MGHWILSTNITGSVVVYDSLFNYPRGDTLKDSLVSFYRPLLIDSRLSVKYASVPKQTGGIDCGLFVVAYAVDIAEGNNPEEILYSQHMMRDHLINCFEKGELSAFPKVNSNNKTPGKKSDSAFFTLEKKSLVKQNSISLKKEIIKIV